MNAMRDLIPMNFQSAVRFDEPMAKHTTWHVGGLADAYYTPNSANELAEFLSLLPNEVPVFWLGLGSNTLIRDGGVRGVVVSLHLGMDSLERRSDTRVHADAGVPCAKVSRQCARWLLGSAEFFAGIPGTIGGALAMNAGAWGGETWPHVAEVDVVNRIGQLKTRAASEYRFGYRHLESPVSNEWFIAARFDFPPDESASQSRIKALLEARRAKQPIGTWNCGSTFTNPPGDHAARLIEISGLKGFRIGGAVVSEKHANFIINDGDASATDIERLILHIRTEVKRMHAICLNTEVRIIGEPA
jgi:UDP-N-acetylmuramate dehydrogenase